jgi:hypothetical protein
MIKPGYARKPEHRQKYGTLTLRKRHISAQFDALATRAEEMLTA